MTDPLNILRYDIDQSETRLKGIRVHFSERGALAWPEPEFSTEKICLKFT